MPDFDQLRKEFKTKIRFKAVETMRYAADLAKVSLSSDRNPVVRVLLVSDNASYTSEQQFAPLLAERREIRRRSGAVFHHQLTSDVLSWPPRALANYQLVGVKLDFRRSSDEAVSVLRQLRQKLPASAKIVYFDGDDDLSVQWPAVLEYVDSYLKKHCFKDRQEYTKVRIGKSNLTDYVARTAGISFEKNIIPSSGPVPESQLHKIAVSWNVGLDDKIRNLFVEHGRRGLEHPKSVDVVCRATVSKESWIYPLRAVIVDRLAPLSSEFQFLLPTKSVPPAEYYEEMLRSRICVSPFGYGEICWRDFEAILCGAVIVKPDMSHVETAPDVFRPNETYVPVRWDYSDIADAVRGLLADPARCERIRRAAFDVLERYYAERQVVSAFDRLVRGALHPA